MKSERRHELQHNELAQWLIKSIEAVKPYQNLILVLVVAGVVGLGSYRWWSWNTSTQSARAWDEVNTGLAAAISGGGLDNLMRVAETFHDTSAGRTAAVLSADLYLDGGCNQLFVSKAPAQQDLSKAMALYEPEIKPDLPPELVQRATFGLARAKESKGDLPAAEEDYREIVRKWPNGAYSKSAQQRLDDLARPETKRMYDDFAHFDPKPAFSKEPGLPGDLPNFDEKSLPDEGPVNSPKTSGGSTKAQDKGKNAGKETKPVEAKKSSDGAKPAEKKPAEKTIPAGEKAGK
jgi:hypothetical protein